MHFLQLDVANTITCAIQEVINLNLDLAIIQFGIAIYAAVLTIALTAWELMARTARIIPTIGSLFSAYRTHDESSNKGKEADVEMLTKRRFNNYLISRKKLYLGFPRKFNIQAFQNFTLWLRHLGEDVSIFA